MSKFVEIIVTETIYRSGRVKIWVNKKHEKERTQKKKTIHNQFKFIEE